MFLSNVNHKNKKLIPITHKIVPISGKDRHLSYCILHCICWHLHLLLALECLKVETWRQAYTFYLEFLCDRLIPLTPARQVNNRFTWNFLYTKQIKNMLMEQKNGEGDLIEYFWIRFKCGGGRWCFLCHLHFCTFCKTKP